MFFKSRPTATKTSTGVTQIFIGLNDEKLVFSFIYLSNFFCDSQLSHSYNTWHVLLSI